MTLDERVIRVPRPAPTAEPLPIDDEDDEGAHIFDLIRDVRVFLGERGWQLDTAAITSEGLVLRVHSLAEEVAE